MSDIVERLRSKAIDCHVSEEELYNEAADEIGRLKAEAGTLVQRIAEGIDENKHLKSINTQMDHDRARLREALKVVWQLTSQPDVADVVDEALNGTAEG